MELCAPWDHRQELPGKYPIFTMVVIIYHYVERIEELFLPLICSYNIYDHQKYDPGKPVNIHIQPLMNIIQENNRVIKTKKS